jgi:inosose dehydratase
VARLSGGGVLLLEAELLEGVTEAMMSRRALLRFATAFAAQDALARNRFDVHLGVQTNAWPVDPHDFSSLLAVLAKIKAYGYEGFETGFANVQDQFDSAAQSKEKIAATGLSFFGCHIFLGKYDPETNIAPEALYKRVAAGAATLGAERLILSGAPPGDQEGLRRKADALNRAGAFASSKGLGLAYHNHGMEFENNAAEMNFLLRETDQSKVSFVMDAGHAFHAGADIPSFLRDHHRRLVGMHLRDFKQSGKMADDVQVPLGQGNFPLTGLMAAIRETGWRGWLINEEERLNSKPGDGAVRPARDTLFQAVGERI